MTDKVARGGTHRGDARFESAGQLVDPVNPLVDVIDPNDITVITDAVPVRDSLGRFHHDYSVPVDAVLGPWRRHWTATIGGAFIDDDDYFEVIEAGSILFPSGAGQSGPCRPWCSSSDTTCCGGLNMSDADTAALFDEMALAASSALFHRTWQKFNGVCSVSEQLCRKSCACYSTADTARPLHLSSGWVNCGCGQPCEDRCNAAKLWLPWQPVAAVDAVAIDGQTLATTAWELDHGWLVRTDGQLWPSKVTVNWSFGTPPPPDGVLAACVLACEFTKACLGQKCALPRNTTSQARQGVTRSFALMAQFIRQGLTGLGEVDLFLSSPWATPPTVVAFASEPC